MDEVIHMDSQPLFNRPVAAVQGADDSPKSETRSFRLMHNSSSRAF